MSLPMIVLLLLAGFCAAVGCLRFAFFALFIFVLLCGLRLAYFCCNLFCRNCIMMHRGIELDRRYFQDGFMQCLIHAAKNEDLRNNVRSQTGSRSLGDDEENWEPGWDTEEEKRQHRTHRRIHTHSSSSNLRPMST